MYLLYPHSFYPYCSAFCVAYCKAAADGYGLQGMRLAVSFNYLFLLQLQHTTIDNRAINRGEVFLNGKCRETVQLAGTIPDGKPR